ncbi:MAG TPA: glycosyltransferase family 4 protein [Gemmatimonadaceae bacterium]
MTEKHPALFIATIGRPAKTETGVQTHVNAFMRYAASRDAAVRLLTPFNLTPLVVYPVFGVGRLVKPVASAAWVWWYRLGHGMLLRVDIERALRRGAPAIIYAQDLLSANVALGAKDAGYAVEVVLNVHSYTAPADEWVANGYIHRGGRLYRRIERMERETIPRVDRLVFPSEYAARDVRRRVAGAASVPSWRVPNFVVRHEPPVDASGDEAEMISIGPLLPNKNHEFLIRVLAQAHRMGRPYRLVIVGNGPLRKSLGALAAALGVDRHVTFAGFVPEAARLIPRHRVYVHAAHLENCCISVLEALAAGRPVLAAPRGGVPEQFTDGVEGFYWDSHDAEGAAHRLVELLDDAVLYRRMARAARERYETHYAPEVVAPRIWQAVLGSSTEGSRGEWEEVHVAAPHRA